MQNTSSGAASPARPADPYAAQREAFFTSERARDGGRSAWSDDDRSEPEVGLTQYAKSMPRRTDRSHSKSSRVFGPIDRRNLILAYLFWFIAGQVSLHRFYCGASGSAWKQLGLLIGSVIMMFVLPPLGAAAFFGWIIWVLADLFLMPGLLRRAKEEGSYEAAVFA